MKPFDPFDPRLKSEPYVLFKEYRDENPVQYGSSSMPGYSDTWYIFGFEEARQLLKSNTTEPNYRSSQGDSKARSSFWQHLEGWPLFQDPPLHTERRALLASTFREPAIATLHKQNQEHAELLIQNILQTKHNSVDIQAEFSFPLAVGSICRAIGIPAPDTQWFKSITRKIANVLDLGYVSNAYEPGIAALNELVHFVNEIIQWKTNHLGHDLLSALLQADVHGNKLTNEVITQLVTQILFAGQETVGDTIGNGIGCCLDNPDQYSKLKSKPDLMGNFIAEILRFQNPVVFMGSRVLESETRFGDSMIPAGANTIVSLAACNRDPRRFDNPELFDISRDLSGTELSFGHGIHYCLGAHYARQVVQIAFTTLIDKLPHQWQLFEQTVWRPNTILRGPISLTISF